MNIIILVRASWLNIADMKSLMEKIFHQFVSSVVERFAIEAGGVGSNPGSVTSDKVSPTARHHCVVFSDLRCSDAKLRRWITPLVTRFGVILRA